MKAPTSSPWGQVQNCRELAPGIWKVDTARHGGLKLSATRNRQVPAYMRQPGGWYEEDCEWAIVATVFEAKLPPGLTADARRTLRNYFPDAFEEWTGVKLVEGESFKRDEHNFAIDNENNFVVRSASGDWADWVPAGMVGCTAKRGIDDVTKSFFVPADEYAARGSHGFVIDLTRHKEVKDV
jgi:hypothetical protein